MHYQTSHRPVQARIEELEDLREQLNVAIDHAVTELRVCWTCAPDWIEPDQLISVAGRRGSTALVWSPDCCPRGRPALRLGPSVAGHQLGQLMPATLRLFVGAGGLEHVLRVRPVDGRNSTTTAADRPAATVQERRVHAVRETRGRRFPDRPGIGNCHIWTG